MKGFFEVWGEGTTWEELQHSVNAFPEAHKLPWLGTDMPMKVSILGSSIRRGLPSAHATVHISVDRSNPISGFYVTRMYLILCPLGGCLSDPK